MEKRRPWEKPHVRIYLEWMLLPAWVELSVYARALLPEILRLYKPSQQNWIELSDRRAAIILKCSRPTAAKTLAELVECGWLDVERVGQMSGKYSRRASAYSLTMYAPTIGEAPRMSFMKWRPQAKNGQNQSQQRPKIELTTVKIQASKSFSPLDKSLSNLLKQMQINRESASPVSTRD